MPSAPRAVLQGARFGQGAEERQKCLAKLAQDGRHPAGSADVPAVARRDQVQRRAEEGRGRKRQGRRARRSNLTERLCFPRLAVPHPLAPPTRGCLAKFALELRLKGMLSVERFKRRSSAANTSRRSSTSRSSTPATCAARAAGWMWRPSARMIDLETLNRTINDAKAHGNAFFGILGGEPFMHPRAARSLAAHPDCYFQVFTNGQFITEKIAKRAAAARQRHAADQHRRPRDRQRRAPRQEERASTAPCAAWIIASQDKLLTGVATSVCQTNIDELLTEELAARADRRWASITSGTTPTGRWARR